MNPFLRFWCYQLKTYDCDPSLYAMKYLMHRFEFNLEQRYWMSWLYANTYHLPTAWVMWHEFPDFENVGVDRLTAWVDANKHRLPYQKDQKWLRGRLAETFLAYQREVLPLGNQFNYWTFMADDFKTAWQRIQSPAFPRFGRYTAWFYLQTLNEICGHRFCPPELFLSDPSSKQVREGLVLSLGDASATNAELEDHADLLILQAHSLLWEDHDTLPVKPDRFSLETSLCAWSKMPRGAPRGRYLGYYLDRMAHDIVQTSAHSWCGVNWNALWDARNEILHPELCEFGVDNSRMDVWPAGGGFGAPAGVSAALDNWFKKCLDASCL